MHDRTSRRAHTNRGRMGLAAMARLGVALVWLGAITTAAPAALGRAGDGVVSHGGLIAVPRPGESCPDTTPAPGESADVCNDTTGPDGGDAGGGLDIGGLLPILAAVVLAGAAALLIAFFVLRRRVGPPMVADADEWWTCPSCGATNVVGSARCYACGTWQG
jgi:hypothetical protein